MRRPALQRHPDWPARLDAAVETARSWRFAWGRNDCALWTASVVRDLTGEDFAADLRGRYRTRNGALVVMARAGGLACIVTRCLGDPVPITRAHRGDVCLACFDTGPSIGVCIGDRVAFTAPTGLSLVGLLECELAWHV